MYQARSQIHLYSNQTIKWEKFMVQISLVETSWYEYLDALVVRFYSFNVDEILKIDQIQS